MFGSAAHSASDSLRAVTGSNPENSSLQQLPSIDGSSTPSSSFCAQRLEYFFLHSFNATDHLVSQSHRPPTEEEVRDALKTMETHVRRFEKETADSGIGTSIHSNSQDSLASRQTHRQVTLVEEKLVLNSVLHWYRNWIWKWAVPQLSTEHQYVCHGHKNTTNGVGAGSSSGSQSGSQSSKKKRKYDGGQEEQGKDGGVKDSTSATYTSPQGRTIELRLACPFLKHNPTRYFQHQPCMLHWPNTARLKLDHLYKHHMLQSSTTCRRCGGNFSSEAELNSHARQLVACTLRPVVVDEGIDADKRRKLQDKKLKRGCTEEEKWFAIFDIIFPTCDEGSRPDDPYWDLFPLKRLQIAAHLHAELPSIIGDSIRDVSVSLGESISNSVIERLIPTVLRRVDESLQRFRPVSNTHLQEDPPERIDVPHRSAARTRALDTNSDIFLHEVYLQVDTDLRDGQSVPTALGQHLDDSLDFVQLDIPEIYFADEAFRMLEGATQSLYGELTLPDAHAQHASRRNDP
ncbi:hypothetical protein F4803DRAFT_498094 [Xylaria telfairii]|nr:hypothetical protein F4803DRAFT_498094 [Xylaria telfairii]